MSIIDYDELIIGFKRLLKENNLKYTHQRELILKALYENEGHFTPEDIYNIIKRENSKIAIGIATVYRTLGLLEESGMVDSLSFDSKGKKYELGLKKHHDHLVCTQCGRLIEFYDETIEKRQEEIAKEYGFKMLAHAMRIDGICNQCQ
jgi:Fur family transcriptional regulator, ferric uptake regulator